MLYAKLVSKEEKGIYRLVKATKRKKRDLEIIKYVKVKTIEC